MRAPAAGRRGGCSRDQTGAVHYTQLHSSSPSSLPFICRIACRALGMRAWLLLRTRPHATTRIHAIVRAPSQGRGAACRAEVPLCLSLVLSCWNGCGEWLPCDVRPLTQGCAGGHTPHVAAGRRLLGRARCHLRRASNQGASAAAAAAGARPCKQRAAAPAPGGLRLGVRCPCSRPPAHPNRLQGARGCLQRAWGGRRALRQMRPQGQQAPHVSHRVLAAPPPLPRPLSHPLKPGTRALSPWQLPGLAVKSSSLHLELRRSTDSIRSKMASALAQVGRGGAVGTAGPRRRGSTPCAATAGRPGRCAPGPGSPRPGRGCGQQRAQGCPTRGGRRQRPLEPGAASRR